MSSGVHHNLESIQSEVVTTTEWKSVSVGLHRFEICQWKLSFSQDTSTFTHRLFRRRLNLYKWPWPSGYQNQNLFLSDCASSKNASDNVFFYLSRTTLTFTHGWFRRTSHLSLSVTACPRQLWSSSFLLDWVKMIRRTKLLSEGLNLEACAISSGTWTGSSAPWTIKASQQYWLVLTIMTGSSSTAFCRSKNRGSTRKSQKYADSWTTTSHCMIGCRIRWDWSSVDCSKSSSAKAASVSVDREKNSRNERKRAN